MSPRLLAPSLALGLAAGLLTAGPARAEDHAFSPGFLLSLSLGGGSCGSERRATWAKARRAGEKLLRAA